jgi:hypothetical protein
MKDNDDNLKNESLIKRKLKIKKVNIISKK